MKPSPGNRRCSFACYLNNHQHTTTLDPFLALHSLSSHIFSDRVSHFILTSRSSISSSPLFTSPLPSHHLLDILKALDGITRNQQRKLPSRFDLLPVRVPLCCFHLTRQQFPIQGKQIVSSNACMATDCVFLIITPHLHVKTRTILISYPPYFKPAR